MKRAVWFLLLLGAPSLHAAIRGTVFASGGGALENARVAVYRRENAMDERERLAAGRTREALASAATDAQGAFAIDPKLQGVFDLQVTRDGYVPWRKFVLADDSDLAVELTPAPLRNGRVSAGGKAVAGAIVIVENQTGAAWSTRTDEKGSFTIPEPKRWAGLLRVVHPDHAMQIANLTTAPSLALALTPGTAVHGKVIGTNRRPVAHAKLFAGGWPAGTTREDGTFTIAHLSGDAKTITAFSGSEHGSARRSSSEVTIQLEASHAIAGVVRDSKERPLSGARVVAWPTSAGPWEDVHTAITDDKGNYRIEWFDAKDYRAMPDAADLEFEDAPAALRTTRTARLDFTAKRRTYLLGTVIDERRKPVGGARVQTTMAELPLIYALIEEGPASSTTTTADGRFRLGISEEIAKYGSTTPLRVQATHPRYAGAISDVKSGAGASPVTITLRDGIEVRGKVKDKDGNAIAGAGVLLVQDPFGTTPLPLDAIVSSGTGAAFIESDAEGAFTLHLNEAPHDLAVWKQGFAGFHLAGMTPAAGQKPIEVVLEPGIEIRGRVIAKQGGGSLEGTVFAEMEIGGYLSGTVAADGSFAIVSPTPGKYTLQYTSQNGKRTAEKVVKAPATDVVIELPVTGELHGRVIDKATNAAVSSFSVRTRGNSSQSMQAEEIEGEETFTLNIEPGFVSVSVQAPGYVAETQQVTVDEKTPATVAFALTRGRTISGRVTNEAGLPVAGVRIFVADSDSDSDSFNMVSTMVSAETSPDGEFELTGVRREPVTLSADKQGFLSQKVDIEGDIDRRVSIVLSTGRKATGRVVTAKGEPVGDANVWAFPVTADGSAQQTKSAADGSFVLEGLSDSHYSFSAMRSDLGRADSKDVDPAAAPVVITFQESKGTGAIHGTVKGFAEGTWTYGSVTSDNGANAMIRRDGTYRIEKVPAGEVALRAFAMNGDNQISVGPVKATVAANEDIELNLAFSGDITMRGTVTEGGQPAAGRSISFSGDSASSQTTTDEKGAYAVTGLEPGLYRIEVQTSRRQMYTTRYPLSGSTTFDIAINYAQLQGRAIDEAGAPQSGVQIEVTGSDAEYGETVATDAAGAFVVTVNEARHYLVSATKKGFATWVQSVDDTRTPVVITLVRSAGLRVRLSDARDGKTLPGYVVATNATGLIAARAGDQEKDGAYPVPLPTGAYRVSVSANGYASQSARVSVPMQGELRLALTPGGNLVVRTERASSDLVKLVLPSGEEYVRCQCNGIAEIRLTGTITTIDHIAPGRYTMQVLDAEGRIKTSYPVTIEEGQTTIAEIHVPE